MNGFHIKTKVIVDHKTWPLSYSSNEVSESVKTSVRGKIELKQRKRLIFMWSFRKPATKRGLHLLVLLSTVVGVAGWGGG